MARATPTLETERLRLRPVRLEDFDDSLAMWTDPVVTKHFGGRPASREDIWGRLLRYAGHWQLRDYGYWIVVERASGRYVGEVGLAEGRREITPSLDGVPESGWALMPWAHGRGYATEAVRAALHFADQELRAPRTVCIIAPANTPSVRVAEKLGYKQIASTVYKELPTLIFERVP